MNKYRRKGTIYAIQIKLDSALMYYSKFGGSQEAKEGDWLVQSPFDTYTVNSESFAQTYEQVGPCEYRKTALVYAEQAKFPGVVYTKEGETRHAVGDWVVRSVLDESDRYAMTQERFAELYELVDD